MGDACRAWPGWISQSAYHLLRHSTQGLDGPPGVGGQGGGVSLHLECWLKIESYFRSTHMCLWYRGLLTASRICLECLTPLKKKVQSLQS